MIKVGHDGTKLELLSLNVPSSEENKSQGKAHVAGSAEPRALSEAGSGSESASPTELPESP